MNPLWLGVDLLTKVYNRTLAAKAWLSKRLAIINQCNCLVMSTLKHTPNQLSMCCTDKQCWTNGIVWHGLSVVHCVLPVCHCHSYDVDVVCTNKDLPGEGERCGLRREFHCKVNLIQWRNACLPQKGFFTYKTYQTINARWGTTAEYKWVSGAHMTWRDEVDYCTFGCQ